MATETLAAEAPAAAPAGGPVVRAPAAAPAPIALSVVIPVHDEEANIGPLVAETLAALHPHGAFEIVCVDDRSADRTLAVLRELAREVPQFRALAHSRRRGQSAAIRTGVKAARGAWIATMDGDGQNDPRDIPRLLAQRDASPPAVKLLAGWRVDRKDSGSKRWASRWANRIRAAALRDRTPDTGCGIKLFERAAFLDLPYFDHMHRYLPALMQRAGWTTVSVPVSHRPRLAGRSKYGNLSRAAAGLWDLLGVAWLLRRSSVGDAREIAKDDDHDEQ